MGLNTCTSGKNGFYEISAERKWERARTICSKEIGLRAVRLTTASKETGRRMPKFHREQVDVNTLYRVMGQRVEQITGNDEKHQMKASQNLSSFSLNIGLRAAKGINSAQLCEKTSVKKWITRVHSHTHTREQSLPQESRAQIPFHLEPH